MGASEARFRCCIAGGGPAGMMLGLLLARAGVPVVVLEKHADFLRDFRGDTVHPSTLEVMYELGLLDALLARPHDELRTLRAVIGHKDVVLADFGRIPARCGFIAMVPQWEFLAFLRDEAARHPTFQLRMCAEVTGLVERDGRVAGVYAHTPDGPLRVDADLVVAADGRHSAVRATARMPVRDFGAPIDVLWIRLPKAPGDPAFSGGRVLPGRFLVLLDRGTYWQCAFVIPKGALDELRAAGLPALRTAVTEVAPLFAGRTDHIASWDDVRFLSVRVDRLDRWWRPGLLCIGDAAHAMSPIGGVGINLAIQDAVAAANVLAGPLSDPRVTTDQLSPLLARVQRRRMFPTRVTQAAQVAVQDRVVRPVLAGATPTMSVPWSIRLLDRFPVLRVVPAYLVGVGVRPEHVRSPSARAGSEE